MNNMNNMNNMNGVIVIDKPAGFTSFDVIAVARRLTGQRKMGHTGTLDPNATGVLPVLLGTAAKAQDLILNSDKAYTARFRLGLTTDTLDIWGQVKSRCESCVTRESIETLLPRFTGEIEQVPPMFSAVQINGKRAYQLARKGESVELKPKLLVIDEIEVLAFDEATMQLTIRVVCSKGTYIRALARDIGKKLNSGAHLIALRRTRVGETKVEDCYTIEQFLDELEIYSVNNRSSETR